MSDLLNQKHKNVMQELLKNKAVSKEFTPNLTNTMGKILNEDHEGALKSLIKNNNVKQIINSSNSVNVMKEKIDELRKKKITLIENKEVLIQTEINEINKIINYIDTKIQTLENSQKNK